jgi:hypothetical protein
MMMMMIIKRGSVVLTMMMMMVILWMCIVVVSCTAEKGNVGNNVPTVEFDPTHSSPALIVMGLRDHETDYIVADMFDTSGHRNSDGDGDGDRSQDRHHPNTRGILLHEFTRHFFGDDDRSSAGHRVMAFPDYQLNSTAFLRLTFWFPCEDPPPADETELLVTPCFFDPLAPMEYLDVGHHGQQTTSVGRRTTFYVHHPPHIDESWIDVAREAYQAGTHDIKGIEELDHRLPNAYGGATTRVSCWFPDSGATLPNRGVALPINLGVDMNRLVLGDLHYRSPRRARWGADDHFLPPDQRPQVNREPEVWYGKIQLKENVHSKLLPPLDKNGHPVQIRKRPYCRSVLTVMKAKGDAGGWTVSASTDRMRAMRHRGISDI